MENVCRRNKKILLHICCAPDATYPIEILKNNYEVVGFFYNPNIHPKKEYELRLKETIKVCDFYSIGLIYDRYDNKEIKKWFFYVKKYKNLGEGSKRCYECIKMRLLETAKIAKEMNFDAFTTTLSISPHKSHDYIRKAGKIAEDTYDIKFLFFNFREKDGFKKSIEISKKLNLYRQNYCGCIFSKKESEAYKKAKKERILKMFEEYKRKVTNCTSCGKFEKRFFYGNIFGRFFVKSNLKIKLENSNDFSKDFEFNENFDNFYTLFPKCIQGNPEECYKFLIDEIKILKPNKIYMERDIAEKLKIGNKIKINGKKIKIVVVQ